MCPGKQTQPFIVSIIWGLCSCCTSINKILLKQSFRNIDMLFKCSSLIKNRNVIWTITFHRKQRLSIAPIFIPRVFSRLIQKKSIFKIHIDKCCISNKFLIYIDAHMLLPSAHTDQFHVIYKVHHHIHIWLRKLLTALSLEKKFSNDLTL